MILRVVDMMETIIRDSLILNYKVEQVGDQWLRVS